MDPDEDVEDLDIELEDDEPLEDEVDDQEDPEAEDSDEDTDVDLAPAARQPSRADNRVAAATKTAKEAKDRADMLERQLADMQRQQGQQQQQATQAQIAERLAQMDPGERAEYIARTNYDQTNAQLAQMRFEAADTRDKLEYDALASRVPAASKLKDEVESTLAQLRASGMTAPRQTILERILGQRALNNAGRATGRAQKAATATRERQTARPTNGRADTASGEGRRTGDKAARDKRMANYEL